MPPNDVPRTIGLTMPRDIAERAHVVAPLRQVPGLRGTILASTIAPVVQKNDLSDIRQGRIGGSVDRVVEAGAAVKQQQCRLFPHDGTIRHQLGAFDVEEQAHPVDVYMHWPSLPCEHVSVGIGARSSGLIVSAGTLDHAAGDGRRMWKTSHIFGVLHHSM